MLGRDLSPFGQGGTVAKQAPAALNSGFVTLSAALEGPRKLLRDSLACTSLEPS